ncbi:unnamed protein product [Ectocarpus sp. CCAP 1310/34]|nr:unnamed protein product [Ectocarpus sp. CCAP 1310/34]
MEASEFALSLAQDEHGQISGTHSIAAGLDYPGVGPKQSWRKDSGRAGVQVAGDDAHAIEALQLLARTKGIISAPAHAVYHAMQVRFISFETRFWVLC